MHRNMTGNRRGNRGNSNRFSNKQGMGSSHGGGSSGLMADNLQLRELDLELALLKRKREIIETQHTILVNENRGFGSTNQYGFTNQPAQSYSQRSEQTRNFGNYNDRFDTPQGVKRPAINPWADSEPQRFSGPSRPKKQNLGYNDNRSVRPQSSSQIPSLMNSFSNTRPSRFRTNFRPSRGVTKPKQKAPAPNKLNSYNKTERARLVDEASEFVRKTSEPTILEADKPANPKVVGRLELALGSIVREMRNNYGSGKSHAATFQSTACQRALKKAIRERIHAVMVGKPVGQCAEIVDMYRKAHPKKTDMQLLMKVREGNKPKNNFAIAIIQQANPEKYFKNNFNRLLNTSLNQMFERLHLLYKNMSGSRKPLQEIINSLLSDMENLIPEKQESGEVQIVDNNAVIEENIINLEQDGSEIEENAPGTEKVATLDENETATEDNTTTENDQETENIAEDSEGTAIHIIETPEPEEAEAKQEETTVELEETVAESEETNAQPEESDAKAEETGVKSEDAVLKQEHFDKSTNIEEFVQAKFYSKLMDSMFKKYLPIILPKYKEKIMNVLNADETFKKTEAYLIYSAKQKAEKFGEKNVNKPPRTSKSGDTPSKYQLFVKVVGIPMLPKKKLMKTFLDDFHPTLIKKHRFLHNILFISFDSKENFDNILAQDGTEIGNSKLEIKISEKINKAKKQNPVEENENTGLNSANDVEMTEVKNDPAALDDSLNDQINDLLNSISEEEKTRGGAEETVVEENEQEEVEDENFADGQGDDAQNDETNDNEELTGMKDDEQENEDQNQNDEEEQEEKKDTEVVQKDDAANTKPNQAVNTTPNQAVNTTPNKAVNATPNRAVNATPNRAVNATPNRAVNAAPNRAVNATPNRAANAMPNKAVAATPNQAGTATPNKAANATPNKAVSATPTQAVTATPNQAGTATPQAGTATPNQAVTATRARSLRTRRASKLAQ